MRYVRYVGTVRDGGAINTAASHAGDLVFVPFPETDYSGRCLVLSGLPPTNSEISRRFPTAAARIRTQVR
jgi:hypothetical protein